MFKSDLSPSGGSVVEKPSAVAPDSAKPQDNGTTPPPTGDGVTQKPETAPEEKPSEEVSLEKILDKEEVVTYKKSQFPKTSESDLVKTEEGYEVRAEHTYNDIDKMFNVSGNYDPNPKLFFSIMKRDPEGANSIAKACGWKSSHYAKAAIEEFIAAKSEKEKQQILEESFPEFTWKEGVDAPFNINYQSRKEENGITTKETHAGFSKEDITRAVNDYVADTGVSKDKIMKSASVAKLLEEFSVLRDKDGQSLSLKKALEWAVNASDIKSEPIKKENKTSAGSPISPKEPPKRQGGVSEGAKRLAESLGYKINS